MVEAYCYILCLCFTATGVKIDASKKIINKPAQSPVATKPNLKSPVSSTAKTEAVDKSKENKVTGNIF